VGAGGPRVVEADRKTDSSTGSRWATSRRAGR
jgi:hypothetical protein